MPKKTKERPEKKKTDELLIAIDEALKNKNYYFTRHALERSKERKNVSEYQILRILKSTSKYHEANKDGFHESSQDWNYSIRGKSVDSEDIRIILSFDKNNMLIITVINLND